MKKVLSLFVILFGAAIVFVGCGADNIRTVTYFDYETNSTKTVSLTYKEEYTLPIPTRLHYTFVGYGHYENGGLVTDAKGKSIYTATFADKNTNLFQVFTENAFVWYDFNTDDAGEIAPIKHYIEDETPTLPTITKDGFTFKGWKTMNQYNSDRINCIAQWERNILSVTVKDGNTNKTIQVPYGETITNYADGLYLPKYVGGNFQSVFGYANEQPILTNNITTNVIWGAPEVSNWTGTTQISIPNDTKSILFDGITATSPIIVNSARAIPLTVFFRDCSITSATPFNSYSNAPITMVFVGTNHFVASSSIYASINVTGKLTMLVSGDLTISGNNGTNGIQGTYTSFNGTYANEGGRALASASLFMSILDGQSLSNLTIEGGSGGRGGDGYNPQSTSGQRADNGGNGGNGASGANAISVAGYAEIKLPSGQVTISGGHGGAGGRGGNGANCTYNSTPSQNARAVAGNGGDGKNGGSGGTGISVGANSVIEIVNGTITGGLCGYGGAGGTAGTCTNGVGLNGFSGKRGTDGTTSRPIYIAE